MIYVLSFRDELRRIDVGSPMLNLPAEQVLARQISYRNKVVIEPQNANCALRVYCEACSNWKSVFVPLVSGKLAVTCDDPISGIPTN